MFIQSVELTNFRKFANFKLDLDGRSVALVSENASGKSSILAGIARALGKERATSLSDFGDPDHPIEVVATLAGFSPADQVHFPKEFSFGKVPSLRIGYRAQRDPADGEISSVCGFPDLGWKKASKEQRDALKLFWLPAFRDPARLLQFGGARGYWHELLVTLSLGPALGVASKDITGALQKFGSTPAIAKLLTELSTELGGLIPGVDPDAFSLGAVATADESEVLQQFEVLLAHGHSPVPVHKQSNGLIQLAIFTVALKALEAEPGAVLLVDEPEISLHPQAQRAISLAIAEFKNQSIVATHSSSILDRADLRQVVRLDVSTGQPVAHWPSGLTQQDAERLARFVNPITAEACFARKVIFVEGYSDRIAVMHLFRRLGRNLDAEGITVLSLEGGAGLGPHLRLVGPQGLKVELAGLCDEDKEKFWLKQLQGAGFAVSDRASMKSAGFLVSVQDLEDEFVKTLGVAVVETIIAQEGADTAWHVFQKQPQHSGVSVEDLLRQFLHKEATRWAMPLVDGLSLPKIPSALNDLVKVI